MEEIIFDETLCEGCGVYLEHEQPISHDEMFYHGTDENESQPAIELVEDYIDNATTFLLTSASMLSQLNMRKKMKSINGIVKNIEIFKKSIRK